MPPTPTRPEVSSGTIAGGASDGDVHRFPSLPSVYRGLVALDTVHVWRTMIALRAIMQEHPQRYRIAQVGENGEDGVFIRLSVERGTPRAVYGQFLQGAGRFRGIRVRVRRVEAADLPERGGPEEESETEMLTRSVEMFEGEEPAV
jgi:hypothetical protein